MVKGSVSNEQKANGWLVALSILIPLVGLIVFLTMKELQPKTAKVSGICALVSFCITVVLSIPIIIMITSTTIAMNAGTNEILEKAKDSKAKMEISEAKDIVALNLNESKVEYLYENNSDADISEYIMKGLKKSKKELKDKEISVSITASGDKIYLTSDNYKVTVTVSDNGNFKWSEIEEK